MRLRHFLILMFVALTLIPIAFFRAWPDSAVFETELEEVEERHLLLARNLAAALERYHRDVSNMFELVISTPNNWRASGRIAASLSDLGFTHVCIADGTTGALVHQFATRGFPCPNSLSDDLLKRFTTMATFEVGFSEVTQDANGQNILHVIKALPGGQIAFGDLRTDYFIELGQAISFGKRGHAAIVDHAGNVLFHPCLIGRPHGATSLRCLRLNG